MPAPGMRPYHIFRTWIWELLALVLAIGLISAITVLLAIYDGKPAPHWGFRLNFNALLALLSTIHRAMVVAIVSQVISQRKWEWFAGDRTRPLADLQQFDSGSRGSFGALLLIPTVLWKDVVTLIAAIILLASFLVGPFVQQASRTSECSFPALGMNASIPFAHYVPRSGGYYDIAESPTMAQGIPTPDIAAAILSSIMAPEGVENQINPSCSSGNCTFPEGDPEGPQTGNIGDNNLVSYSTVGMCNICADVVSLVTAKDLDATTNETRYALPNGFNFTYDRPQTNTKVAEIWPTEDLEWMADLFTPELRAASRWAYINATFMGRGRGAIQDNANLTAVMCSLYPCLRTYTVSITNNQLDEREIRSDILQADTRGQESNPNGIESWSSPNNPWYHYTAVRAPCRIGENVYDKETMSSLPNATNLTLYSLANTTGDDSTSYRYEYRNVSAPEQCIYRQNAQFVQAISSVFHNEIFVGDCNLLTGLKCYKHNYEKNAGMLTDLGAGAVLRTLFNNGAMHFDNVNDWFNSFTNAMTSRFRFEYGTNPFNDTIRSALLSDRGLDPSLSKDLPSGLAQGLAWQTTTCIAMHIYWLLLPVVLTFVTVLLSVWTIFANWRHRHDRPVWKESILPLIFYGHRIESTDTGAFATRSPRNEVADNIEMTHRGSYRQPNDTSDEEDRLVHEEGKLMEASEMMGISKNIPVTFRWPNSAETTSTAALQQEKLWLRRRKPQAVEADSLLGGNEESLHPASKLSTISTDTFEIDIHSEQPQHVSRPTMAYGRL
ncbi:hypothetical protein CUC08_Gglean004643 [Alternaria sp. MG1]|nr:hypothetical protein CUC08_Gglean004643 [Alternaria sp. MG1]RYO65525.1 hypothetical protein AA0116_g2342 [Alternaria tenuissima]